MALPATASLPQNASIVSRWNLGEASGTRADSVGLNTLQTNGTTGQTTGQFSANACTFDGSTAFLSIANGSQSGLGVTGNFSCSVWVKLTSWNGSSSANPYTFMGKYAVTGNQRGYLFNLNNFNPGGLDVDISSDGTAANTIESKVNYSPSNGVWILVAVVYNAAAGSLAFYANGSQVGTTQTGSKTSIFNNTASFEIGAFDSAWFFNGAMQDAIFWGGVTLSATEVTSLYNAYFSSSSTALPFKTLLGVGI